MKQKYYEAKHISQERMRGMREHFKTTLSEEELQELRSFEQSLAFPSIVVVGKAGAGKDTVGEYLQEHHGYGTDSMAGILKVIAERIFAMEGKDRRLLQSLAQMRSLSPSCYLDNVWRRILKRRRLSFHLKETHFIHDKPSALLWVKWELFRGTDVSLSDIDAILREIALENFGSEDWGRSLLLGEVTQVLTPLKQVVLTDARYPNELAFALSVGAKAIVVEAEEDVRLERLRLRDGHADRERLNHSSETALDVLLSEPDVAGRLLFIDNNAGIERLNEKVEAALRSFVQS